MSRLVGFAYTETALRFLEANIPKTLRTSLEAKRKELKAPALERSRLIDSEAKRIESEIRSLEDPIDALITAEEQRRERERAERQAACVAQPRRRMASAWQAGIDGHPIQPARTT